MIALLSADRASTQVPTDAAVLQHHKSPTRDGHYIDPAFTPVAAARLRLDAGFHAPLNGPTYAQPLYWAATSGSDRDMVIAATEQNEVSALDPVTGDLIWHTSLGPPVPRRQLMSCGNINPVGITGTPIIDPASRTLFVAAMTVAGGAATHIVTALSIDDGSVRAGWPVDVSSVTDGSVLFEPAVQGQRGALAILDDAVYIPYGGHFGDCGSFRGWVVGVPIGGGAPSAWATRAVRGGIWGVGGIASDGTSLYVATGNTSHATRWSDGEAIIRLQPGPVFSGQRADYAAPANWRLLDWTDRDLGGSGVLLLEVPGASPARLAVALGKDGNAYLGNQANLGGLGRFVAKGQVASRPIINGPSAYTTRWGTYVVFRGAGVGCPGGQPGDLTAIRITATAPPSIRVAWCASQNGSGSPIVTTTDGQSQAIVWSVGAEGDNRLRGFDGDTGHVIFNGGGIGDAMSKVRRFQSPIVARGRIYVAADSALYAFTPP